MVFTLTFKNRTLPNQAEKHSSTDLLRDFEAWLVENPSWLEDKGFGGIQAQVITPSTTFPDLEFSNPGKARGFDDWYESASKSTNDSGQPTAPTMVAGVKGKADKMRDTDKDDIFMVNDRNEDWNLNGDTGSNTLFGDVREAAVKIAIIGVHDSFDHVDFMYMS